MVDSNDNEFDYFFCEKFEIKGNEYNAFFYTLISDDTRETYFSMKRKEFLLNQGYTYEIIDDFKEVLKRWPVESDLISQKIGFNDELLEICNNYDGSFNEEND